MDDEIVVAGYRYAANKAVIVCEHVFSGTTGRCFFHEDDGDLQLTCGAESHDWTQGRVIALSEALQMLPEGKDLPVVGPGFCAEWNDDSWIVGQVCEPTDDQQNCKEGVTR